MSCCPALLILVCGSLAAPHPVIWAASSSGTAGRISNLERTRMTGKTLDEMALGGSFSPKGNNDGTLVPLAVTVQALLPTYDCWFYFLGCPSTVSSSRSPLKEKLTESLFARYNRAVMEQAVMQALGGRYITGDKHQEDKKTSTNSINTLNSRNQRINSLLYLS